MVATTIVVVLKPAAAVVALCVRMATEVGAEVANGLVAAPAVAAADLGVVMVAAADGAEVAVGVVAVDGAEADAPDFVALVPWAVAAAAAPGSPEVLATA